MKMIALAGALCLLFSSSTLCKANSSPWCAADAAVLNFKNGSGHISDWKIDRQRRTRKTHDI
jgi:hypothetical protein